jgi:hypothetical protein
MRLLEETFATGVGYSDLRRRVLWVVPSAALSGAIAFAPGGSHPLGLLILLDQAVHFLPWRVPRWSRSTASYACETVAYLSPLLAIAIIAAHQHMEPLFVLGSPVWYLAALVAGATLVLASRLNILMVIRGELAFLTADGSRGHALARASSAVIGGPLEEVLYRGVVIYVAAASTPLIVVLGAVAFVARHHVTRGVDRLRAEQVLVQGVGTVELTVLAYVSGSVYPAIAAHLIANLPTVVLEVQRATYGGTDAPQVGE